MNYTLNQLQIFSTVARTGSVTKAAEQLNLTQPAVSIQLRNFQDQFEVPLTEVVGRRLYITDFGKEIATAAEKILDQVQSIDFHTQAHKGQLAGRLKISVVSTGKYVMPYFLTGFIKQHPGVELSMDVTNKAKVINSLDNNEVDFSLVSIVPEDFEVNKINLVTNELCLVGRGDARVKANMGAKELFSTLPMMFREPGSGTRFTMERFIERHHFQIKKKLELTSNEAVKQAVLANLGFSIMPLIGIRTELRDGLLKIIPVKGLPIKTMWQLIWMKGKRFSTVASAFLEYIEKEKDAIVEEHFTGLMKSKRH